MPKQSSLQNLMSTHCTHAGINQFYGQYVAPNHAALGHTGPVIDHILTLIDDKGNLPCFTDENDAEQSCTSVLREYSLSVARMAVDMIKKAHRHGSVIFEYNPLNFNFITKGLIFYFLMCY